MVSRTVVLKGICTFAAMFCLCLTTNAQQFVQSSQACNCGLNNGLPHYHNTPGTPCHCGCGGQWGCVENPGNCNLQIIPGGNSGHTTTEKIHVTPPTDCEGTTIVKKFYEMDYKSPGTIKVPTKVSLYEEKYRFERKSYCVCGCTIKVCVPCAIDTTKSDRCKPMPKQVELVARVRTGTNLADIWVYNIQGLPSQAVLGLKMTATEANNQFGSSFSY